METCVGLYNEVLDETKTILYALHIEVVTETKTILYSRCSKVSRRESDIELLLGSKDNFWKYPKIRCCIRVLNDMEVSGHQKLEENKNCYLSKTFRPCLITSSPAMTRSTPHERGSTKQNYECSLTSSHALSTIRT